MSDLCENHHTVQLISNLSGGISFIIWLVAQLPQSIEIYQNKSVDGISPYFILIWLVGDFTGFIGCILTAQLPFQIVIATYFLMNDVILCGQYYYYKYIYKRPHHHKRHSQASALTRKSNGSLVIPAAAIIASNIQSSTALPIGLSDGISSQGMSSFGVDPVLVGSIAAWIGAVCYFFSRLPQLYKNYQRKSTEDISPFLFACTLSGNLTYTISILVSCEFLFSPKRWEFFINELPYMIGSAGTIIFDVFYFYQVWIYREKSDDKDGEDTPLLRSD